MQVSVDSRRAARRARAQHILNRMRRIRMWHRVMTPKPGKWIEVHLDKE